MSSLICETDSEKPAKRSTVFIHRRISVSASTRSFVTLEAPALSPFTFRSASTWRSVTGSMAGIVGAAKPSMVPNVDDENFGSARVGGVQIFHREQAAV